MFLEEKLYSKWFTIQRITQSKMDHWRTVMPEADEKLGNAPPNKFMPKPENLINMKKARVDESKGAIPELVTTSTDPYEVWFKQDDTFDQPLISIKAKIVTNDGNFPQTN